jgi:DNA polymerase-3 subunit epsilon
VYPNLKSHALGALARQLGISFGGTAHRAAADAEVTANVMITIARELQTRHSKLSIDSRMLRQLMRTPIAAASSKLARMNRDCG